MKKTNTLAMANFSWPLSTDFKSQKSMQAVYCFEMKFLNYLNRVRTDDGGTVREEKQRELIQDQL